jgi:hypothetical protein
MVPSEKQASKLNKYGSQLHKKLRHLHVMCIRAHPSSMLILQQVLEDQDKYYNNIQEDTCIYMNTRQECTRAVQDDDRIFHPAK